jgi:hypothetical protein
MAPARGLTPLTVPRRHGAVVSDRLIFWVTLAAIVAQLTLAANLLDVLGIHYETQGGSPLVKFHPGTYLTVLAVALQAWRRRPVVPNLVARVAGSPHFPLAAALMIVCALYALLTAGMSGTAVYIESYVSAALLGFAMERLRAEELRWIATAMVGLIVLNTLICVGETATEQRLVPVHIFDMHGKEIPIEVFPEFRGAALYDNPLTGAMLTMIGTFLCLATDWRPALKTLVTGILLVGLIAFGGRSAMAVTDVLLATLAMIEVARRLARRRMNARIMTMVLVGLVAVPAVLTAVLFETPLGERIATHFYADDSAEVRIVQWQALAQMDWHDLLFGMNESRLTDVMLRIGLDPPLNDIENFWLLVFLNLGVTGFTVWATGFLVTVWRLWRAGGTFPRLILLTVMLVASGSNSLGRKSNILFVTVAAVLSAAAFAPPRDRRLSAAPDPRHASTA